MPWNPNGDAGGVSGQGIGAGGSSGASGAGALSDGGIVLPLDGSLGPDLDASQVLGPGHVIAEPQDDAAFLWDDTQLRTFELTLTESDLAKINADPAKEEFVPGAFALGNEQVSNVGIRYKGSAGGFYGCVSGGTLAMPSGMKTCPKLSIKVAFDYQDAAGRFHGLKKLNFHSMNDDDSLMHDRLGYALFREMGLAAPRCVHARLLINGKFAGLYALVEEIDGRFTDSRFDAQGDGNLYKEIWPKWTDASAYAPALHTNRDSATPPSFDRVVRFATAVEGAASDAPVNAIADSWLDMSYTMDFIAVDRTILNDDGMFHWYCNTNGLPTGNNPGNCSSHNYYWYEEAEWDRLWLIEWDVTLSFKADRGQTLSFITIADAWDAPNPLCTPKTVSPFAPQQLPPSCDKLTHAWGTRAAEYKASLRRFLDGPFSKAKVDAKLSAWTAQVQATVSEAETAGQSPSASAWRSELTALQTAIADLRSAAESRAQ